MPATLLTSHIEVSEHLQFRKTDEQEFFEKKGGGGGSSGTISKSTVVLFCYSIREGGGWVVIFRNFEKSAYVPSKKYLHPPKHGHITVQIYYECQIFLKLH